MPEAGDRGQGKWLKLVKRLKKNPVFLMLGNPKSQFAVQAKFTTNSRVLLHELLKWYFNRIKTLLKVKFLISRKEKKGQSAFGYSMNK